MTTRQCISCGKMFEPSSWNQKWCGSTKKKSGCSYKERLLRNREQQKKKDIKKSEDTKLQRITNRINILQKRRAELTGFEYPSFFTTIINSPQWKEWVNYNEQIPKFDVYESMECGWLSEKHFQAFMSFYTNSAVPKNWENHN
jgi:hypothetical protein